MPSPMARGSPEQFELLMSDRTRESDAGICTIKTAERRIGNEKTVVAAFPGENQERQHDEIHGLRRKAMRQGFFRLFRPLQLVDRQYPRLLGGRVGLSRH